MAYRKKRKEKKKTKKQKTTNAYQSQVQDILFTELNLKWWKERVESRVNILSEKWPACLDNQQVKSWLLFKF